MHYDVSNHIQRLLVMATEYFTEALQFGVANSFASILSYSCNLSTHIYLKHHFSVINVNTGHGYRKVPLRSQIGCL